MNNQKASKYDAFVFFSAGPVGDQAIAVDYANRFFEASGKHSFIISKHPNAFLSDLLTPYYDHIQEIKVKGRTGIFSLMKLMFRSIYHPYCYVLALPIALPTYMKVFAYFIRFCTRSRMIGLNSLSGFYMKGGPVESAMFLGKSNYISANVENKSFTDQANDLLEFLGYPRINRPPTLAYVPQLSFLSECRLEPSEYLVFHLVASHSYRSLPPDRWNNIIKELRKKLPEVNFVFSGASQDKSFIDECLEGISKDHIINLCRKTTMQELLTLYASARLTLAVHTGNSMILNMLHVPAVIVNMKGPFMYNYFFNKKAKILISKKDCTCHPFDVKCTQIFYNEKPYMACVYNTSNEEIISTTVEYYNSLRQ